MTLLSRQKITPASFFLRAKAVGIKFTAITLGCSINNVMEVILLSCGKQLQWTVMFENTCTTASSQLMSKVITSFYTAGQVKIPAASRYRFFILNRAFSGVPLFDFDKIATRQLKKVSNGTLQGFSPTLYREGPCFKILIQWKAAPATNISF